MITAIFTNSQKTTLTIETAELLNLVPMGHEDQPIELGLGVNNIVVGGGWFKVLSKTPVRVTADTPDLFVASTTNSKDGGFPDPPKLPTIDQTVLHQFFVDARGQMAPR